MGKISFEGIGEVAATFACEDGVEAGKTVKVTGTGLVGPCAAGDRFCGVALSVKDGYAAVQVAGLVTLAVSGQGVSEGWLRLTADGSGGVKMAGDGDNGGEYLVAAVESGSAVALL